MTPQAIFREGLASVVVFLVALPLCLGIAIASGVPPAMGLVSGIIGGIVVGTLAGSPLQVSGPAAGLAVIVFEIVHQHGLVALGPILVLAGIIQMVAGRLHLGQWFRAVAPAVIYGMLSGIGVLIFASQFHVMVDDKPVSNGVTNFITIPYAIMKGVTPVEGTPHHLAAGIGMLSLTVLVAWNFIRTKLPNPVKMVPAPLLAIAAAVAAAYALQLPINYVSVPKDFTKLFNIVELGSFSMLLDPAILAESIAVAVIASAEALLCAVAVDKLHDGERTQLDKELFAQGVGNTISGFLGGLPITGVIVRSSANVEAGAKTRWSGVAHGIWLLIAVAAVPFLLEMVPVAALAAVLVYIGFKLVNFKIWGQLWARGRDEFAIYAITVIAIVATNLLEGLLVGVALSVLKLAWSFSNLVVDIDDTGERVDVRLKGSGTFVGLPILSRALQEVPADRDVHIHLEETDYVDHACFELLSEWSSQYELSGGNVEIEWDTLTNRGTYKPGEKAA